MSQTAGSTAVIMHAQELGPRDPWGVICPLNMVLTRPSSRNQEVFFLRNEENLERVQKEAASVITGWESKNITRFRTSS